jgi:phosphatidylglycerol---prolipoprotein diacylglyceryl transferase
MHPYLFAGIRAYPVMLGAAVVVGLLVTRYAARRAGMAPALVLRACAVLVVAGLLGSKLDAFIENGGAFYGFAVEAQNNFRYPGAIIALALAVPFAGRLLSPPLDGLAFADLLAPAVCWAMATFRIGCLLEGCCFGTPTRLPWAVRFPAGSHVWADEVAKGLIPPSAWASLPVHPLEIYFLLLAFGAGAFLLWLQPRKRYDGQVVLLFLALHEPGKFLLEFLRAQPAPHLQVLSLAFAVIAWSVLLGRRLVAARSTPAPMRFFLPLRRRALEGD